MAYCDGCGVAIFDSDSSLTEGQEVMRVVPYELLDMDRLKEQAAAMAVTYQRETATFLGRRHAFLCRGCTDTYARRANDPVSHPAHYTFGTLEVIEVIEDWGWGLHFCLGNTVKYVARAGRKDPAKMREDLEKARWYLDRAIQIVAKGS